eukprot:11172653-Lingulodinium_polyedra.AAC.1
MLKIIEQEHQILRNAPCSLHRTSYNTQHITCNHWTARPARSFDATGDRAADLGLVRGGPGK